MAVLWQNAGSVGVDFDVPAVDSVKVYTAALSDRAGVDCAGGCPGSASRVHISGHAQRGVVVTERHKDPYEQTPFGSVAWTDRCGVRGRGGHPIHDVLSLA